MGTHGEIHNDNIIKATMEELTEEERKAYLIAEEHLKEQFLQGFKKERGGLFKKVEEFVMPSFKLNQDKVEVLPNDPSELVSVAKMASHAIFQYNVLAIDDTRNT